MSKLKENLARFAKNDDGATMVEYGILVSLISIAGIVAIQAIGPKIKAAFDAVNAAL